MEIKKRFDLIHKAVEEGTLEIVEMYSSSDNLEKCIIYADGKKLSECNSVTQALVDASCDIPELYDYILDYIKWRECHE